MTEKLRKATHIEATFPDGQVWRVPAHVIADNRARYYAEKDADTTYQDEYDFTISDAYELSDWFANNMDPEDVEAQAERVQPVKPLSFCDGWRHEETERRVIWEPK